MTEHLSHKLECAANHGLHPTRAYRRSRIGGFTRFQCALWQMFVPIPGAGGRSRYRYLGHNSPQTTALYTHLTVEANEQAAQIIEQVVSRLAW